MLFSFKLKIGNVAAEVEDLGVALQWPPFGAQFAGLTVGERELFYTHMEGFQTGRTAPAAA